MMNIIFTFIIPSFSAEVERWNHYSVKITFQPDQPKDLSLIARILMTRTKCLLFLIFHPAAQNECEAKGVLEHPTLKKTNTITEGKGGHF